jgi:ABC-type multidrug transport system ATPase subunit
LSSAPLAVESTFERRMIEARDLRIDADGSPCVDGLTFSSSGDRVLILGAPRELMLACAGLVPIVRGELRVEGEDASRALALGRTAACPLDAPLPPNFSPLRYVEWSGRLAGVPRADLREAAEASLAHVGLAMPVIKTPLRRQTRFVRRATQLAAALLPAGATLLVWNPLEDLAPDEARMLEPMLVRALGAVRAIVFAARAPRGGALASAVDEAIVLSGSTVLAQGSVLEVATRDRRFLVRAMGDVERFAAALTARGARLSASPNTTAAELAVDLGTLENADVFRAAVESDAVVVEMRPIAASFA